MLSKRILYPGLLLLSICLTYANSFHNGFHFDDFHTVIDNPAVRSLANLRRILTDTTAFSVLPANQTYRPAVTASLALDYALGRGYTPVWFHLSTFVWFLTLVALLFLYFELLLNRLYPDAANFWLALGVAAWFGLHPAMAETVNYIIQRGDLYCTLGCVAGLYLFALGGRMRRYGLYLLPFALAMLSKPTAVAFPVLLLLYVYFFEANTLPRTRRWRMSLIASVPAFCVTAVLLWLQAAMTPKSFTPSILSPASYRLTEPFVWMRYGAALFLPLHLNVDTDLQPFGGWNARAVMGLGFAVIFLLGALYAARHRRLYPIAFGMLWFLVTQLPTSLYPLSEVENDHRMFFSFPGLMLAVVWGAYLGYRHIAPVNTNRMWLQTAVGVLACLCLGGYAGGAYRRNQVWRSEATLWADDVAKSPGNGRGLMIYGLTRMNDGDYAQALDLFTRASRFTPNYPTLEINLGVVNALLARQGRPALEAVAEEHFTRALRLAPGDDTTHAYYGRWLLEQGRLPEATRHLERAVALNPQRALQRDLLLNAYAQAGNREAAQELGRSTEAILPGDRLALAATEGSSQAQASAVAALIEASLLAYREGRFQQSIESAQAALRLDPHSAEAWNNVGAGYGALGRWDLGIAAEQRALEINPHLEIAGNNLRWFQAQNRNGAARRDAASTKNLRDSKEAEAINLSLALNRQGRYTESLSAARAALAINPRSAEAWNNVAANQEALHQWDLAIAAAEKAVALRPDFQLARNNLAWSMQEKAAQARDTGISPLRKR